MAPEPLERRLAAILSADAVGYSRLMVADDEATVRTLQDHRRIFARLIDSFRGRLVDSPGDNLLAEFPSAVGAVRCALEIQQSLGAANEKLDADRRMPFRIGIHLGDVMVEQSRIYGEGVNIAARLEGLSAQGGICMSDIVYQQVRRKLELAAVDLGEQQLKHIEGAVRAHQLICGGEASAAPAPRAVQAKAPKLALPEGPSLAVLPFANLNGDPREDYFSDGLTGDIMAELVRIPGLFLIGEESMFTYKSTAAGPRDVAREVGVRHVLEGSVRRDDKRVRVTVRLIDAATGQHLWADRYDAQLGDLFAVQDEIADQVVTALDVELVHGEDARTLRRYIRNPKAITAIYKGQEMLHRFTREDMHLARQYFAEAMELEPECPYGYADAAWTHYFDVDRGWTGSPAASLEKMSELSHRAIQLQDLSGFSHLMLGHLHLMKREHEAALALSSTTLEERPSCNGAFGLKANILNYLSQPEEAIPLAEKSVRLSPVSQPFFPEVLATSLYLAGRHADATQSANDTLAGAPDSVNARAVLVAALVESGGLGAAREAAREIVAIDPRFTLERFAASQPYREAAVLTRLTSALEQAGLPHGNNDDIDPGHLGFATPYAKTSRRVAPRPRR